MTTGIVSPVIEDLLTRLDKVKGAGRGQWVARCPAHEDREPSLSIGEGADGRVLLTCHAGCDTDAIVRALGLGLRDLFPESDRRPGPNGSELVAAYDYLDESGTLLFQVCRFHPKTFRQRAPDGNGWRWKMAGVRRVLYRLPDVRKAAEEGRIVFVVEGEKDADRLGALGFVATTNPGGSGKWRDGFTDQLAGTLPVILPDNDEPGRDHAATVARELRAGGLPVRVVHLPGLPDKGDVCDWLDGDGTADRLRELVKDAETEEPDTPRLRVLDGHELFAVPVVPQPMLVRPHFPHGRQGAVFGGPGIGKSMLTKILAGGIATNATNVLGNLRTETPGVVLILTNEEDEQELKRGMAITAEAQGYDLQTVLDNTRFMPFRDTDFTMANETDVAWLEERIREIRPVLMVADSLASLSGSDLKDDQAILPRLRWGARLTAEFDMGLLWTAHDRKSNPNATGKSNDLDDLFGSRQVSAQIDYAYRLVRAGEDRVLKCAKMRGAAAPEDLSLEVVIVPDKVFGMRCVTSMSRVSRESELVEAVRRHLEGSPGDSMSGTRDTVAEAAKRRPADVGDFIHVLIAEGFVENRGTSQRFKLHWTGKSMSGVSQRVPDNPPSSTCPHVPPPVGGDQPDMGHGPGPEDLMEEMEDAA